LSALHKLQAQGLGILLIEQNVGVAAALADEAFILADGTVAYQTTGAALIADQKVIRSYLGR